MMWNEITILSNYQHFEIIRKNRSIMLPLEVIVEEITIKQSLDKPGYPSWSQKHKRIEVLHDDPEMSLNLNVKQRTKQIHVTK